MLIYQLLFPVILNDYRKVVKSADHPPNLESVYQINHHLKIIFPYMIQKTVLQVHHGFIASCICHALTPFL